MGKKRADILLFEKGLVDSREKGKRVIMEGSVYIGTRRIDKPGEYIEESENIIIKTNPIIYVSRGGLKLEKAIESFDLDLSNLIAMDIGASTGGFTDCMLKNGAKKVFAVDVGYGQLDWKLRNDPRVIVMERTNIRNVTSDDIGEEIDFISIDVSFISLTLVLPVAKKLLAHDGKIVALVKPQFEAGRERVGKKGIVRDKKTHFDTIKKVVEFSKEIGLIANSLVFSPITGTTGNIEFLLYLKNSGDYINDDFILKTIVEAHNILR
ncbi:TlyA family RNA methyltransferase [Paratissierella segnis]|jgi:23S rRNA (cytidine1920-2'-O)/16S rRNA (cytidine1409-2'-O)-methyltransferase|uniref:TlyA family RNA methyltransferase n=1 Tax=Paratissierella segnis TaxID=2763679 RepID=A0A926EY53_9FIRM|nr:TlyA family RNA methyltransferase [Paratissierella segnis]MBC8588429.1 TlyA family RNA methyltransferase [Paratissierella segnis]